MNRDDVPRYIVVEGPIGVGKTSLCRRLADSVKAELLLEGADENPFLEKFYQDPRATALPVQLFFLFQRAQQIQALRQSDMFSPVNIADFLMDKDRLFAQLNLDDDEFRLYEQAYSNLTLDVPQPDLVIYLQAPVEVLAKRVHLRGRSMERHMDANYMQQVVDSYTRFFHYYNSAPLLIVNTEDIDLVNDNNDYKMLLDQVFQIKRGRHYYNPTHFEI